MAYQSWEPPLERTVGATRNGIKANKEPNSTITKTIHTNSKTLLATLATHPSYRIYEPAFEPPFLAPSPQVPSTQRNCSRAKRFSTSKNA